LFKIAAALVVVSRDMEKQLAALGAPPEKIHYNPCSVDMDEFQGADPGNAAPTFMATGRYVNKKGPHLTLLAFATVVAACPDARLIMVGDGYLRPACEDLVRALGIEKAVQFIGFLPHTSVATLMRNIRGFVQHSIEAFDGDSEGTPVAIMEAAATGLPILATSHAGIKEVVKHGETGFLVEPGDIDSMAEHWINLARDPALAGRMGMAGRGHIGNSPFERSRSLANLLRIVESVISKTGA
jgi:glycosyltransferase involved in cell wall biosynthesis